MVRSVSLRHRSTELRQTAERAIAVVETVPMLLRQMALEIDERTGLVAQCQEETAGYRAALVALLHVHLTAGGSSDEAREAAALLEKDHAGSRRINGRRE